MRFTQALLQPVIHPKRKTNNLCSVTSPCYLLQKNTSDILLQALDNIMSALLIFQGVNEAPTIIQHANIAIFVKR